jgi:hypothetical protein
MRLKVPAVLVVAVLAAFVAPAQAVPLNSFQISAPGPLTSTDIVLLIENNDHFAILAAFFDTSGTTAIGPPAGLPLLIGGPPFAEVNNTGGSATFVGDDTMHWHYNFSDFATGDSFQFNWDPDILGQPSYGAIVAEQAGLKISLLTTQGLVTGILALDESRNLVAVIPSPTAVPEPTSLLLLGSGLTAYALRRRRQS